MDAYGRFFPNAEYLGIFYFRGRLEHLKCPSRVKHLDVDFPFDENLFLTNSHLEEVNAEADFCPISVPGMIQSLMAHTSERLEKPQHKWELKLNSVYIRDCRCEDFSPRKPDLSAYHEVFTSAEREGFGFFL
jgi:hypothetical protein